MFANEGAEDDNGNAVGDATTDDDITIGAGAGGDYTIAHQSSFTNTGGVAIDMVVAPGITLATPLTITDCTNATPAVVTSTAHGLKTGDSVTISGVGGATGCNGNFHITWVDADSFQLQDITLTHADVAGGGAYTTGGTVDVIYPGAAHMERNVSNTALGRGAARADVALAAGDVVELYVANLDSTANVGMTQVSFSLKKVE